jgi:hypothetical protein
MGPSGLAEGKKVGIGGEPTGVASLRAEAYEGACELLHVCTAFSSPFGKASLPPPTNDWLRRSVEDGVADSSFCATGEDETNRDPPASAPTRNVFVRCNPQDTAKCS